MTAYLIVRAEVAPEDHDSFDHWYETEHLPDAHKAFGSRSARRGWSDVSATTHVAIYEFDDLDRAREAISREVPALVAEFDRVWQDRVTRARELVGVKQTLE